MTKVTTEFPWLTGSTKVWAWGSVIGYILLDIIWPLAPPFRLLAGLLVTAVLYHHFYARWPAAGGSRMFAFKNYALIITFVHLQILPASLLVDAIPWAAILFLVSMIGFFALCRTLPA